MAADAGCRLRIGAEKQWATLFDREQLGPLR